MPGTTSETPKVEQPAENGGTSSKDIKKADESADSRDTLISEAGTLLAQGKRHLFVKDYSSAVASLGDACGKFSEIYGELAYECADAYFNYGCALLELAREESGVLDVDNKDKDSVESEEGNDESDVTEEAKKEDSKTEEIKIGEDKTACETEANKTTDVKDENSKNVEEEEEKSEGGEEEEAEEEDVNNLQLSWEIFELAKRSFQQQNDELKLAETFLKLGEVALESENYDGAINDIQQCLELQKKILPPVCREIAETQFQLGVACSLSNQFDEAIKHFTTAGELLESRIQNLSKMTEPEPDKAKNPFYSINNEIEEIKLLLPEIKEKITDMKEFKEETMKAVQASFGVGSSKEISDGGGPSTNGASSSTTSKGVNEASKPVNDISHLIRKKRKPEDSSESESKKPNLETKTP